MKLFEKSNKEQVRKENDDYKVASNRKYDLIIAIVSLVASIVLWLYVIGSSGTSI